jgi:hypothetical protein
LKKRLLGKGLSAEAGTVASQQTPKFFLKNTNKNKEPDPHARRRPWRRAFCKGAKKL